MMPFEKGLLLGLLLKDSNKNNGNKSGRGCFLLVCLAAAFKTRVTPHKLRHTLATRLYQESGSQVLVSHQLGHSSTQITDLYTHIAIDEQRDALKNL